MSLIFSHVLVAEDHQSLKFSIEHTLRELGVPAPAYAYNCDQAFQRLNHAKVGEQPFELLITDLSFTDVVDPVLKNGLQLIKAVREAQPQIQILVFSVESNPAVVYDLFQHYHIDGFVRKSKNDAIELRDAILTMAEHKKYIPLEFRTAVRDKNAHDFSAYDIAIVSQLAAGESQKNIPDHLKKIGLKPASLRSVEKQLNLMRVKFGLRTNEQLIAYCKDRRII